MDPRVSGAGLGQKMASNAVKIQQAKLAGTVVNLCPWNQGDDEQPGHLDDNGYCRHLVGFVTIDDKKHYEPMVRTKGGKRVVRVKREKIPLPVNPEDDDDPGMPPQYDWGEPQLEDVRKGDQLVWITTTARVYREHPEQPQKAEGAPSDQVKAEKKAKQPA